MVCSAFIRNVYYELLGEKIETWTESALKYAKKNIGKPEVIAYGGMENNNFIMKLYDESEESNYKVLTNPSLEEIIPYLQIRRCYYLYWTYYINL